MANVEVSKMMNATDLLGKGHSSILLMGPPKTGKTTFTCSGSRFAEDAVIPSKPLDTPDVLLISLDAEGYAGAIGSGYNPRVEDLSGLRSFSELNRAIASTIQEARKLIEKGELGIVGIDLGALANFILLLAAGDAGAVESDMVSKDLDFGARNVNWQQVSAMGLMVYRALRVLPCTVIGMAHPRITENNFVMDSDSAKITPAMREKDALKRDAGAIGGKASKLTADLTKGVVTPWVHNASNIFARDVSLTELPGHTFRNPKVKREFMTHLHSNEVYSVGSRFASQLPPSTDKSLRWILDSCRAVREVA